MENWQFWFMIGSGIYLLILGIVMIVKKDLSMNKAIGIYNIVVGALSLVGALVGKYKVYKSGKIFSIFTVVLIVSFLMFTILKAATKKR
ncbi:hypothetical protein G8S49_13050 [Clostridium botulinum C]|uniref:Uncharacterized protein n=2 Tax=Clostridium botulinum TaxID=1491 RepID=A0A9Q4XTW6_CLOBO|nr:hypothetical protein [Clostridium botulinum]EGO87585.1 hypothetical protein CBCST_10925 [Clostridium botulinum C str. Stockholm]MCD3196171.1 hypothetical protein [Clostridium botulinum C]MCD3201520.1 hypothetical protein [Clostridium botulinum C]MCD3207093.1 hypothetical protein [Clostridium botulinum C]MCD3209671.1 hypothetical protein [Clostridium botulinum C]